MIRLLETDQLNDQMAALAWLQEQDFVQPHRIATAGNSFGGIEAVLGAERGTYCAAVDGAGGAESWAMASALQAFMVRAVKNARVPIFFFQAESDYDLSPSLTLSAAMKDAGKTSPAYFRFTPFSVYLVRCHATPPGSSIARIP
jgi:dienelactone hydrolase